MRRAFGIGPVGAVSYATSRAHALRWKIRFDASAGDDNVPPSSEGRDMYDTIRIYIYHVFKQAYTSNLQTVEELQNVRVLLLLAGVLLL